jgi:hypothetical protein
MDGMVLQELEIQLQKLQKSKQQSIPKKWEKTVYAVKSWKKGR